MTQTPRSGSSREVLQKLLDADRNGKERVEKAREEADTLLAQAREEAEAMKQDAGDEAGAEAERIVREAREKYPQGLRKDSREDSCAACDSLRQQGKENMDRAVAFLVGWVTGKL